ncbi:FAD-binding protein [Pontibacter qinzhouensis]|uniref:FAD-binding protein n=1 Tax=Pontibacter qinzhouensis TaxID=2603253 RepID=A0A5C8JJK6_9BACT|nr:FAD-binding protein [Pontibacter qinzhouensis]TXK36864.1 FAD-binding protein [Pontibacter qinzhouensis]
MATLPPGIEHFHPEDPWENAHQNFKHRFTPGASYSLCIPGNQSLLQDYNATTANMQWLIRNAIQTNTPLRAMGSNWSFSPVAMCHGGMLNTKGLNLRFKLANSSLSATFRQSGKNKDDLIFVQCGMSMLELNELLELQYRRCIMASGGSNGQSVAGATATGTHGGALYTGAVHDAIVGLHLVTGSNRHVWLERASAPVVSEEFVQALGAEAVRDDDMFHAAVVSFGSFGIIHGVLLQVEPLFLLQEFRFDHVPYTPALQRAIGELDMEALRVLLNKLAEESGLPENQQVRMPQQTESLKLYHLELALNPHHFEPGSKEKGIYIRTFYKIPCPPGYQPIHNRLESGRTFSPDLNGIISRVLEAAGPAGSMITIKPLVNALFKSTLRAAQPQPMTIGETFRHTRFKGQIASAALAVATEDVFRVTEVILELNKKQPFAGALALRFVKGTRALLGFTKFANSCVLEMDGVDAPFTRKFFSDVWHRLEVLQIPYTLHWGKLNFILNEQRVRHMYGNLQVDKWLQCRAALLDAPTRKVFTNDFMMQCGLDKSPAAPVA